MARRQLTRWFIQRYRATPTQGAYAYVVLHGTEFHFTRNRHIMETLHVPLDSPDGLQPKSDKEIIKRAKKLSADSWFGNV